MKFTRLLALASTVAAGKISLPGYPLAERTPYLSGYDESTDVPSAHPFFWQGQLLTWQIMARVNDDSYCLFACPDSGLTSAKQIDISFTSTRTLITLQAGSTVFLLDFFSPISLTDYVRQSIPYTYLRIQVQRAPAGSTVDILTAIDDTWTAQQPETQAQFSQTSKGSSFFALSGTNSYTWAENNNMAAWGRVVLSANNNTGGGDITYQTGSAADIASQFKDNGNLENKSSDYESGNLVALAYRINIPRTSSYTAKVMFALGLEQDNAFNYLGTAQTAYYQATISGTANVVDHLFDDEHAASIEGKNLDQQIVQIGMELSENYSDVLEASMRQLFAAFEILIPMDTKDTSQATAWMKEISTDGNVQTVADLLPKAWPAFYVLAPDYMRLFLQPVLDYAVTWPAEFMFHDLGKHYPNATGETVEDQEALIVDQTSVLHWMVHAYQKATGNEDFIKPYIPTLQRYADYLVDNGLYTASQMSSVDSIGPTPNQTVLAMYSAVALTSFGALTGMDNYTATGKHFADVILDIGTDSAYTHITAHFHDPDDVWISTYPLAFDKMLGLSTFNESTYTMQSTWYEGQLSTYGMPFFSGVDYAVGSLMAWCAASSSDYVRDALIDGIHAFLDDGLNSEAGPTRWFVTGSNPGIWTLSVDKPTVGSYFMPVAVTRYQDAGS